MKKLILGYLIGIAGLLQAHVTDLEKHNLAQKSAPLLKFHPKDDSSLASADWYISRCSLETLKKDGSQATLAKVGSLNPESLASLLKDYQRDPSEELFLNPGAGKEPAHLKTLKGPGYVNNMSEQQAYYNFLEISDNYVKISYWFFCPYQGNIDIVPGVNTILKTIGAGSHEGDWEHIDVRWRKDNNKWTVQDVFFARHGQTKGDLVPKKEVELVNDQMKSDKMGNHPVVYVAMNSHGTYPKDVFFISKDTDKTSDKGPMAFLFGKNKEGKFKLENYSKQPWSAYKLRWGADLKKKLGGSPESPHLYGSFAKAKKTKAELIVNGKSAWFLAIKNGKSPNFKIENRARIKKIDFKIFDTTSPQVEFEIWKKGYLGFGEKRVYGPFKIDTLASEETDSVVPNYSSTLYIKALNKTLDFKVQVQLIE